LYQPTPGPYRTGGSYQAAPGSYGNGGSYGHGDGYDDKSAGSGSGYESSSRDGSVDEDSSDDDYGDEISSGGGYGDRSSNGGGHGQPRGNGYGKPGGNGYGKSGGNTDRSSSGDGSADRSSSDDGSKVVGCAAVCRRAADCHIWTYEYCADICGRAARAGHTWRTDRSSCEKVRKTFVSDKWMCTAEASLGTRQGYGPWSYERVSLLGAGNSRDEAGLDALKACRAIVSGKINLANLSGFAVDGGDCQVSRCDPPGTPL
jgi:hypothetical protein